jgi:hypothetical protein
MKGNLRVSHTGGLPGMLTSVTMIPDLNLGIVVLTNTENGGGAAMGAIRKPLLTAILAWPDFGWIEKYSESLQSEKSNADSVVESVWKTVAAAKNTAINPADYTGIYEDKMVWKSGSIPKRWPALVQVLKLSKTEWPDAVV